MKNGESKVNKIKKLIEGKSKGTLTYKKLWTYSKKLIFNRSKLKRYTRLWNPLASM